jgi:hypothetical protein
MVAPLVPSAGAAATLALYNVTQAAHGFTVGQAIVHNGTTYVLANSSANATLATDVVAQVVSAGVFRRALPGETISGLTGLTPGAPVHASGTTAGAIVTATQGAAPASAVAQNPIGYALTASTMIFQPYNPTSV